MGIQDHVYTPGRKILSNPPNDSIASIINKNVPKMAIGNITIKTTSRQKNHPNSVEKSISQPKVMIDENDSNNYTPAT